jgi:uncharacterized tellurite resistance protein B-like protein
MIDLVRRFFEKDKGTGSAHQGHTGPHDVRVAVCALFLEMAQADGAFSASERDNVISLLKRQYGLSEEHVVALMGASQKGLQESIDLWQFTNLINQNYSRDEKIQIIEMVWQIVYADGRLDQHEDYLAHKLAKLLRLSHKDLIDAKLKILKGGVK